MACGRPSGRGHNPVHQEAQRCACTECGGVGTVIQQPMCWWDVTVAMQHVCVAPLTELQVGLNQLTQPAWLDQTRRDRSAMCIHRHQTNSAVLQHPTDDAMQICNATGVDVSIKLPVTAAHSTLHCTVRCTAHCVAQLTALYLCRRPGHQTRQPAPVVDGSDQNRGFRPRARATRR